MLNHNQIQVRDTSVVGGVRTTISTAELRLAQSRISVEEENRKGVQSKREIAADSLQSIQLKILDLDTNLEGASELGPLQYLSGLTGYGMDRIINWLILIIIFVFDPLEVALVVAFNNALKVDRGEDDKKKVVEKRELYGEEPDEDDGMWTEEEMADFRNQFDGENELGDSFAEELEADPNDLPNIEVETEQDLPDEARGFAPPSEEDLKPFSKQEIRHFSHPHFDWGTKSNWQNDPRAVQYWLKNIRPKDEDDEFTKKTY